MDEHLPDRPGWDCLKCGQTWPCANAKAALLHEYRGNYTGLLTYLALREWEAFDDYSASTGIPPDLEERFTGWVG